MQHAPAEIINEIFKHLILNILRTHDPKKFPWYLGQICASWRAEFTSTTWIWRKFMIDMDQTIERDLDDVARLVKLCIQRSRNQPLSFSFSYIDISSRRQKQRQYANQILSDLIEESQRWEEVEMGADLFFLEAFCLPSNQFPRLRAMALQNGNFCWDKSASQELLLHAHILTEVEIEYFPAYDFDWSRLTVLTLHYLRNVADVLLVVRRLRYIEKLQLGVYFSEADEEQDAMIALPTLKVLSCPGNVLRHLRAPALEELRMNVNFPLPLPDGAISFLRTSSGSITKLILGNRCCIDSDAKRVLGELPNVTKLCLEADLDLSNVLPYNLEDGIYILPKLELLVIDRYLIRQRQWDAVGPFLATMASRANKPSLFEWPYGARKLKELRMISCENLDTLHLRLLCEEHKVKYMAFERVHVGHIWCTEVENCAFELCNVNPVWSESPVSH